MNKEIISKRIKEAMKYRNYSQTDIVNKSGIPKSSLSSYISGKYAPKQTNIYKIAKVLDVNPVWLMGYEVPMEAKERNAWSHNIKNNINTTPPDELDLLYQKYKHLLTEDDKETIIFLLNKRKKGEQNEK